MRDPGGRKELPGLFDFIPVYKEEGDSWNESIPV